jgi:hypothetical protein
MRWSTAIRGNALQEKHNSSLQFREKVCIPMNTIFPNDTVNVGSKVEAMRNFWFTDGSRHIQGEVFDVTEESLAYFRLFTDNKHNYKLLPENTK